MFVIIFSKCRGGSWLCTKKDCPGLCSSWGEGHFKSFDEKHFDFIGNCEYILAKGNISTTDSFSIIMKNVPCGTSYVTCSKEIILTVGSGSETEVLRLEKGNNILMTRNFKRLIVNYSH